MSTKKEIRDYNERYETLQEAYLAVHDSDLLVQMYSLARQVAGNYLRKYCQQKKLCLDIPDLSHDAAMYMIHRYLKPKPFRVGRLSAYLYFGVRYVLYKDYHKGVEEVSYEAYLAEKEHEEVSL
jgi:hypothetical protein